MNEAKPKMQIHVREACEADKEAVFEFCRHTWSWGDYIPDVWDRWLKEENGKVYVATINDVPIGIQHITIDKPGEAWLSGARTAPKYRRMGVATAITMKCLEYAKSKGVKVVRLVTESDNVAALAAVQKMGFKPAAEFIEMTAENVLIGNGGSKASSWANKSQLDIVWRYLQSSEIYRQAAGLYTALYHWYSLDKHDLEHFIEQRKAIINTNKDKTIHGLILVDDAVSSEWRENSIQTCYIDGEPAAISDMTKFLLAYCQTKGIRKIYGFACNHPSITKTLKKLKFEKPAIIFEKQI